MAEQRIGKCFQGVLQGLVRLIGGLPARSDVGGNACVFEIGREEGVADDEVYPAAGQGYWL